MDMQHCPLESQRQAWIWAPILEQLPIMFDTT